MPITAPWLGFRNTYGTPRFSRRCQIRTGEYFLPAKPVERHQDDVCGVERGLASRLALSATRPNTLSILMIVCEPTTNLSTFTPLDFP